MSDEGNQDVAAVVASAPTPQEAMGQLRKLFETLVPAQKVTICDGFGHEYVVSGYLVAKAQIIVMRHLEAIWSTEDSGLGDINVTDPRQVVAGIVRLAANPTVLAALDEAFAVAHPRALAAAVKAAQADGYDLPASAQPSDVFPVEEMVAALSPFLIRLAKRALETVSLVSSAL